MKASNYFCLIIELIGLASILYGCWMVFPPAVWIIGGSLVALIGYGLQNATKGGKT